MFLKALVGMIQNKQTQGVDVSSEQLLWCEICGSLQQLPSTF